VKFRAELIASGNATAVEIPASVVQSLGPEARPAVAISINGHAWRSRVALMRGQRLIGISAANREAAGISIGDMVEVDLTADTAPREVEEPADLAAALARSRAARAAFDRLPYGLRNKHVRTIEDAKGAETRARRIARLIETLGSTA
jgi:antitoxin component of MazEF toxin-antitoxin module